MSVIEGIKVGGPDLGVHMLTPDKENTTSPPLTSSAETSKAIDFNEAETHKETNTANSVELLANEHRVLLDGDKKAPVLPVDENIPMILDEKDKIPVLCALNLETMPVEQLKVSGANAYYYSQLSVMLFEKAVEENQDFPEDLDRVHSWFTKELTEVQKLVCLRELLSQVNPTQNQFLFTSVSFDSLECTENETVWLDQAMSETHETLNSSAPKLGALEKATAKGKLESRLQTLDLTPGESLFYGMNVASKSKLPSSSTQSSSELSRLSGVSSATSSTLSMTGSQSQSTEIAFGTGVDSAATVAASGLSVNLASAESISSKFSNFIKFSERAVAQDSSSVSIKAPPGFLSPNASEFRPSEPSCYSDVYLSDDFTQWLRLLRLHKYTDMLLPHHQKDRLNFLEYSEADLEQAGVCAMGARKKFMRLFERIKEEKNL